MSEEKTTRLKWSKRGVSDDLRTRYRPPCRINHLFFTVAPWIDAALLAVAVAVLLGMRAVIPGVVVDLPTAPFREGSEAGAIFVVNPLPESASIELPSQNRKNGAGSLISVMVFFNDDRFNLTSPEQRLRLGNAVTAFLERAGEQDALLYIDRRVNHGDVLHLVSLLREMGIRRANLVARAI